MEGIETFTDLVVLARQKSGSEEAIAWEERLLEEFKKSEQPPEYDEKEQPKMKRSKVAPVEVQSTPQKELLARLFGNMDSDDDGEWFGLDVTFLGLLVFICMKNGAIVAMIGSFLFGQVQIFSLFMIIFESH